MERVNSGAKRYGKTMRQKYTNCTELDSTGIYVHNEIITKTLLRFSFKDDSDEAHFDNILANVCSTSFYRGIGGHHFSWEGLRRGELRSEGEHDIPTFTMGNTLKTCWLPTSPFKNDVLAIAVGQGKSLYSRISKVESDDGMIPVGVVLKIPIRTKRICFLNQGEWVIKGPLSDEQFRVDELIIYNTYSQQFAKKRWDAAHTLPPVRPYNQGDSALQRWYEDEIIPWKQDNSYMSGLVDL